MVLNGYWESFGRIGGELRPHLYGFYSLFSLLYSIAVSPVCFLLISAFLYSLPSLPVVRPDYSIAVMALYCCVHYPYARFAICGAF